MKTIRIALLLACISVALSLTLAGCPIIDPPPQVFVLGDSISQHYGKFLKDNLSKLGVEYARKTENIFPTGSGGNGRTSGDCLDYIQWKIQDSSFNPDVVLLNAGLHDVTRVNGIITTSITQYRSNLGATVNLLRNRGIQVVWVNTTPIDEALYNATHVDQRHIADIREYNQAARAVMLSKNIPIIDLHDHTWDSFDMTEATEDGVHFLLPVRKSQADYITNKLISFID